MFSITKAVTIRDPKCNRQLTPTQQTSKPHTFALNSLLRNSSQRRKTSHWLTSWKTNPQTTDIETVRKDTLPPSTNKGTQACAILEQTRAIKAAAKDAPRKLKRIGTPKLRRIMQTAPAIRPLGSLMRITSIISDSTGKSNSLTSTQELFNALLFCTTQLRDHCAVAIPTVAAASSANIHNSDKIIEYSGK